MTVGCDLLNQKVSLQIYKTTLSVQFFITQTANTTCMYFICVLFWVWQWKRLVSVLSRSILRLGSEAHNSLFPRSPLLNLKTYHIGWSVSEYH